MRVITAVIFPQRKLELNQISTLTKQTWIPQNFPSQQSILKNLKSVNPTMQLNNSKFLFGRTTNAYILLCVQTRENYFIALIFKLEFWHHSRAVNLEPKNK